MKQSLKQVCDDFIQEFSNSVSLFNHGILNLKKKIENEHTLDDLLGLGQPSVVTSKKREAIAKNATE